MNCAMLSTRVVLLTLAMTLSGCAVKLTNLTPASGPHSGIVNRHEFTADVVPPRNNEIRSVSLDRRGRIDPMRNAAGTIWNRSASIGGCDEIVPYRFVVEYDKTDDTTPPYRSTVFPKTGSYIKFITNLPPECRGEDFGARAFNVTTFDDTVDKDLDDFECLDAEEECSLRAAIMQANAVPGINLIRLPTGIYRLTRMGNDSSATPDATIGDLDITDSLAIQTEGNCDYTLNSLFILPNARTTPTPDNAYEARADSRISSVVATIDANGIDRALDVYESANPQQQVEVYLNCIQIRGGYLLGPAFSGERPIAEGAGVYNRATLLVNQSVIASNNIEERGKGAGIYNDGVLLVRNSAIYNNQDDESDRDGQGFGGVSGGGLYNNTNAVATLEQSLVARNASARAGSIWNHGPISADEQSRPNVRGGELTLVNTTVTDNETPTAVLGPNVAEKVSITNHGNAFIYWSTIAEKLKSLHNGFGRTNIGNSIIVSRGEETCSAGTTTSPLRGAVRILSLGGNFFSGSDCHNPRNTLDTPNAGRVVSDSLVDMGGFTPVIRLGAPFADSTTAVDAVLGGGLPSCPDTDQRGFTRPQNGDNDPAAVCDSGAFERQPSDF